MPEDDMTLWQKLSASADKFNNSSWGQVAPAAVGALAPVVTGGNSTLLGNIGMGIGGAVAMANPLLGAGIMAASALGNAAFGSNINEGAVKDYQNRIIDYSRPNITAQDNTQLMNQLGSLGSLTINKNDLGTQGWFSHKLDKKYNSLMEDLSAANASRGRLIDSAVSNVDKMNDMRIASNYRAFGGPMFGYMSDGAIAYDMARDNLMAKLWNAQNKKQADLATSSFAAGGLLSNNFTNGVTIVGAGGTHENNPNEGVPMGIAEDGQPNLVEEGEAVFNDYVFSNRLRVPKAVRNKYKLRGPKNMTYAEAFIEAQKESEERENDPISKNGLDNIAMILAQSQEMQKAKKNSRKKSYGGHLFLWGGYPDMTPEEFYRVYGFYPEGYNNSDSSWTNEEVARVNKGLPYETEVVTPRTVSSYETSSMTPEEYYRITGTYPQTLMSSVDGNWTPEGIARINSAQSAAPSSGASPSIVTVPPKEEVKETKSGSNNTDQEVGVFGLPINPLRLASIAANVGAVISDASGKTNTPTTFNYIPEYSGLGFAPTSDYVPELAVDTRYEANQAAQQAAATRGAILDNINPNRYANLLAADYNAQIANGELLRNAQIANYDNMLKARNYNRAGKQFDSEMGLRAASQDAQQRLAYANSRLAQARYNEESSNMASAARAANIKALTNSIAGVGQELDAIKWRNMLLDAGVFGTVPAGYRVAYGGKLRKKRGGFTY